jgi:hypothetical protein
MNLINAFFKMMYLPLCRAYSKHIIKDKIANKVMISLCSKYFRYIHHYWPNLKSPESFSEKVIHRMLYNRDERFTIISDKLRVRDYVKNKVGSNYLIPLLWNGDKPEDIPFETLPNKFVIKCNHGCGYNIIVQDKTQVDIYKIKKQIKKWLNENFCYDKFLGIEWSYANIKPTILIEEFIGTNNQIPKDYKLFCYSDHAEYILITFDRFQSTKEKHFSRDFTPLDVWNGAPQFSGDIVCPSNYEEMLRVADTLSTGFDFIRVDLYSVCDKIYFGELTCNPSGGFDPFIPKEYDYIFGKKWKVTHQ